MGDRESAREFVEDTMARGAVYADQTGGETIRMPIEAEVIHIDLGDGQGMLAVRYRECEG
jgi:hypothetical protein